MDAKVMVDVQTLKFTFVPVYIEEGTGLYVGKYRF